MKKRNSKIISYRKFIKELENIIGYKALYQNLINNKEKFELLQKVLKKAFLNKIEKIKDEKYNERKLRKVLNALKGIRNLNTAFVKEVYSLVREEDLKDIAKLYIMPKEKIINREVLKRARKLVNDAVTNTRNMSKDSENLEALREFIKITVFLSKNDSNDINKILRDESLNFEKLKFFENNLKWILNRPEVISIIYYTPLKILEKIKKGKDEF